jgi:SNF2 family DNA or RNA helicase
MGGFQGYEIVEWKNQVEFRRLLDYLTFRVDKDVLDLPPATTTVRRCELPAATRRLYRQIEEEFIAEVGGEVIAMTNVLKRFTKLQQLSSGFIIDDDGNTISLHHEKSKLLQEFLESIDKEEQVVVFCKFRRDLEEVRNVSAALGRSHGELSGSANDLKGGMLPADVNVLAVQIQAGGVGVNLTRARYCAFYSVGYSLADFLQAQARVHRGGQDRPVTYIHLVTTGTMDERVYKALAAKKVVIDEILAYIKREAK